MCHKQLCILSIEQFSLEGKENREMVHLNKDLFPPASALHLTTSLTAILQALFFLKQLYDSWDGN